VTAKTSNLIHRLNVQVTTYGRQTVPDSGMTGHVTHYKIFGAPIISLEWLNLKSSNFVHR